MEYLNYNPEKENIEIFFTIIYVLVDDIYKKVIPESIKNRKNINKKKLTDSEILTIAIVGECLFGKSQKAYFAYIY